MLLARNGLPGCHASSRGTRPRLSRAAIASSNAQSQQPPAYIQDGQTQSLLQWAREQGLQFASVKPATFGGLRGLAAAVPIRQDDIMMSVPRGVAITLAPRQRCPCPEYVAPDFWAAAPWFAKIAVMLLAEQDKGPASRLAPYLASLPASVNSPISWTQPQLQQLQYPHLIQQVEEQRREWQRLYQRFSGALQPGARPVTEAGFMRALALVRSRTFSGPYIPTTLADKYRLAAFVAALVAGNTLLNPGADLQRSLAAAIAVFVFNLLYEVILGSKLKQYAMCPVVDLANHSAVGTAEVSYDFFRDAYIVVAAQPYSQGEQVFVSYGPQTADAFLQYYGFCGEGGRGDAYVMTSLLKWLEELAPAPQARLDTLNSAGLLPALQEVTITPEGFGGPTLQALRHLLAPEAAAVAGPARFVDPADAATEEKLALVMVHAVQSELSALGTSLEQDQKLLGSYKPLSVEATAISYRMQKKRVLRACLQRLRGGERTEDGRAQPQPAAMPK